MLHRNVYNGILQKVIRHYVDESWLVFVEYFGYYYTNAHRSMVKAAWRSCCIGISRLAS